MKIPSRSVEVLKDREITRFASYFNATPETVSNVERGIETGDSEVVRNVISQSSSYEFVGLLMQIYNSTIMEIGRKILDNNKQFLTPTGRRLAKFGAYKQTIAPIKQQRPVTIKRVSQKQRYTGKEYSRHKPTSFKKRELTFLKNNSNKSNKELVRLFNSYFPNRTYSGLVSKKYRIVKKYKIANARRTE